MSLCDRNCVILRTKSLVIGLGVTIYVYVIARAGVIFGIYSRVVGIAAVKSHEAKPSAISPLYRKRVELSQNFTTARAITLISWLHNRGAI